VTRDERGLPATTKSWIDADTYGTTTRTFDPATAVLLSVQKPEQTGTDLATRLQYDSRRLYAEYATNELGHSVHSDVDLATGAARVTEGPEQPDGSWPGGRVVSDGLGRPLRTYVRVDAGGGYDEVLVGTAEYFDAEIPARVRTRQRIELDEDRWIVTDTYVDGLGRTVRQVVHGDEGPAESTYAYDGAGNAISMTAPNPNDEAASPTVTATWEHDALGRVVRVVPPAGAPVVAQYVTTGVRGIHFHRNHREPVIHPVVRKRFFARTDNTCRARWAIAARVEAAAGGMRGSPRRGRTWVSGSCGLLWCHSLCRRGRSTRSAR